MGSAFAIQVMTGKENKVKALLDWAFARNENAQKWIKAVHTFTQGTRRLLGKDDMGKRIERAVIPGYIFIEMNYMVNEDNISSYLPADLWHLVKSVPGVLKLFANAGQIIGNDTFQAMIESIDTEEQVEASIAVEEPNEIPAIIEFNEATTPEQKKQAEDKLTQIDETKTYTEQIEEMKRGEPLTKPNLLDRCKTFLRRNKDVIRFPLSLYVEIINRIDPRNVLPKSLLNRPSFIIPLVRDLLRGEVRQN